MTSTALSHVLNGTQAGSPIELTVYLPDGSIQAKIVTVRKALCTVVLPGDLTTDFLELTPGGAHNSGIITVSWATGAWMHDVDLARSMDAIRLSLSNDNIRAVWSCSPARDRRSDEEADLARVRTIGDMSVLQEKLSGLLVQFVGRPDVVGAAQSALRIDPTGL